MTREDREAYALGLTLLTIGLALLAAIVSLFVAFYRG